MFLFFVAAGTAQAVEKLIIDTDMGADVDDVGAIAVAHYYADQGQAELLAVIASIDSRGGWAAAASDAVNTYYKRPDIVLGANKGPAVAFAGDASNFPLHIGSNADRYGHDLNTENAVEDAVDVYRRLLNSQPDQSVNLVVVGWMSNVANLMASGANHNDDGINKTGKQLLEQKIKRLIVMGGQYPSGLEFNFKFDGPSASTVTRDLDVPMVFTGYELGTLVQSGQSLVNTPADNPVREAYRLYGKGIEPYNRASWDLTAVVYAVEGLSDYFSLSDSGKNQVAFDGSNHWLSGDKKGDYYLKLSDADARYRLQDRLNEILQAQPIACGLSVSLQVVNPSCDANNGSIGSTVKGGVAPYGYNWSNGQVGASISRLGTGATSLRVTDSAGCSVVSRTSLEALSVATQLHHATATQGGSASVELSGGRTPISVQWSTGDTSNSIGDIDAGNYSVTVRDAAGCAIQKTVQLEQRLFSNQTYLEAECALVIGRKWEESSSSEASAGAYVKTPVGIYNMGLSGNASNVLEYEVNLNTSGAYQLYAYALTPTGGSDSLWYRVNGGDWSAWHMRVSSEFTWKLRSIPVFFESGVNKLEVSFREGGLKLDKFFVTQGSDSPQGITAVADNCGAVALL